MAGYVTVSYTHLRAHETVLDLVCRLLLEKKKARQQTTSYHSTLRNETYTITENKQNSVSQTVLTK